MALSAEAQELRDQIISEYDFSPAELAVLNEGLEAWDTAVEAQKAVEEPGVVIRDRCDQIVRNPAVGIAKDARAQFMAAMEQLGVADHYGGQSTHGRGAQKARRA